LNEDVGFNRVAPLLGGLLRSFKPNRSERDEEFRLVGTKRDRIPTRAQLNALIQDGMLVLPPRYFVGFFLDLLI